MQKKLLLVLILSIGAHAQSFMLDNKGNVHTVRSAFPISDDVPQIYQIPGISFSEREIYQLKGNYLIDIKQNIHVFDQYGNHHAHKMNLDSKADYFADRSYVTRKGSIVVATTEGEIVRTPFSKVKSIGFNSTDISHGGEIFLINKKGQIMMINPITGQLNLSTLTVNARSISKVGGNYFTTIDNTLYTFGYRFEEDGTMTPQQYKLDSPAAKNLARSIINTGGNYFFDNSGFFHTVSFDGIVNNGLITRKMKINWSYDNVDRSGITPLELGTNYFAYSDGAVYMVNWEGISIHLQTVDFIN